MKKKSYLSKGMMRTLVKNQGKKEFTLNPGSVALLVLDMQNYFLDSASHAWVPDGDHVLDKVRILQDTFLKKKLPVFQTRHLNVKGKSGMMEKWWKDLITGSSPLSDIDTRLKHDRVPVISKSQYDAFYGTDLHELLTRQGVTQLIIGGLMTHLCCETTARSAFLRGFEVFFLIDGTATYNIDFHRATLGNIAHGFGVCLEVNQVISLLDMNYKK